MRLVSMCSGYGGLDLAVEQAFGATTVAYSEIEPAPASIFARHWPDARPLGDLTAVDWTTVEADIVCAGFPCQDLSYAGKGRGIVADSRSGLWYAIEHALGVLRPEHVVLENVSAIVSRRPGLDVVLAGLAGLGFDAEWACVRASDVGAPHRRERWFLVAHAAGDGRAARRAGTGERSWGGGQPAGDRDAAPDADGGGCSERREQDCGTDRPGLEAPRRDDAGRRDPAPADTEGARRSRQPVQPDQGRPLVGAEPRASGRAGAGDSPEGVRELGRGERVAWGDYAPAIDRWERVLGRPAPAPTDDRGRLSPLFVEWMQGLPQGWVTDTAGLSRSQMLKALGNGVVPQQAVYAITALLEPREAAA